MVAESPWLARTVPHEDGTAPGDDRAAVRQTRDGVDAPIAVLAEQVAGLRVDLPPATEVRAILDPLLASLEAHYGIAPVIYTTPTAYRRAFRST